MPHDSVKQLERPARRPRPALEPEAQPRGAAEVRHHPLEECGFPLTELLGADRTIKRELGDRPFGRDVHRAAAHRAKVVRPEQLVDEW
jgi:hypothetical protein